MQDAKPGSHTIWDCKYHIVWITKYCFPVLGLRYRNVFGERRIETNSNDGIDLALQTGILCTTFHATDSKTPGLKTKSQFAGGRRIARGGRVTIVATSSFSAAA